MLSTVLSMSMVAAPTVSAAATAGDLIKMNGLSSVYYLAGDGKRYVFPNESSYFSWYGDFSSVKTIAQSELESYPLGANVTVRPGTKLVKITTNPKVYAVIAGGKLLAIPDEATATTLYGANWAKRVIDVSDAFFTNYTIDTATVSATAYPQGSLIKTAADASIYYINADGTASKITTEAAFNANRFKWADVITTTLAIPTAGADITGGVSTITDTSSGAGGTIGAGTGLTAALASDTPASTTILTDSTAVTNGEYSQALIPFTKVNFTAASDGDVKVTSVKFNRIGVTSDGDIGNLYLYDGDTKLAEYTSFSSKVATFTDSVGLFTVSKGTTKTITLKGDLAKTSGGTGAGETIGFSLNAAADVVTNGAAVSGSFPMSGNLMSTAAVDDLGHFYFAGAAGSNGTIPTTVKADEAGKELWSVNVTAASQNMIIKSIKLTMVGTIATTDIDNIVLKLAGEKIAGPATIASDKTVTFDLGAGVTLNSGQTKALSIVGDMKGGSGRVFKFTIQKSADVVVYDNGYGVYATPSVNTTSTAFGVVQQTTGNGTSVDSGTITLGVATDSPTGNIPDAATGIILAKFSFAAAGEAVKVDNLSVTCNGSDATDLLANVKLLLDGSQVGTTDTSLLCDNASAANGTSSFTFGNTFVIPAGTTKYVTVVADTSDTSVATDATYALSLVTGSANALGQVTMSSLSTTAQTARTLTVKAGTANVVENTAFADRSTTNPTGTVNATEAQIASFIITAGSGEAITVSQIALADDATSQVGDNFQNLKIKNNGVQIGTTIASCNTTDGTYAFSPATPIEIAAGAQYVVDVFADIKSSPADSGTAAALLSPVIEFGSITATGKTTGSSASYDPTDFDLQNGYISSQGNLTITLDGATPIAQQMVMGATDQEVARFKLAADVSENITISEIYMAANVKATATGTFKNIKLYVDGVQVGSASNFGSTSTSTYAVAPFTGLALTIPRNSNKVIVVKADVSVSGDADSADTAAFSIIHDYDSGTAGVQEPITAKGASSGQSITGAYLDLTASPDVDFSAQTMTVYASKVTLAFASDTPSGAQSIGNDAIVAKIIATNSANAGNYTSTIKYMNFDISQSGTSKAAGAAVEIKVYKNGAINSSNLVATTSFAAAESRNIGDTEYTNGTSNTTNFVDTEISAGQSMTFIVTMDTDQVEISADTTAESIGIGLASDDLGWRDGVITTDIVTCDSLPLSSKTLTYN